MLIGDGSGKDFTVNLGQGSWTARNRQMMGLKVSVFRDEKHLSTTLGAGETKEKDDIGDMKAEEGSTLKEEVTESKGVRVAGMQIF